MGDPLLDDLDTDQRAAVTDTRAPLAILAPAGSGKTRVLTRRIAYRVREGTADARHVLALTFTRKAAGELVDRIRRLGVAGPVTAGTFHAIALAQLRRRAAERGAEPPRVLDRKTRLLAPMLGNSSAAAVADVGAEIEWAKARQIAPGDFVMATEAFGRRLSRAAAEVADLYQRYETEKRKRRLLDFDDVLGQCADAIVREPEFAASQRWRFRHLFVDEFQDASPLQLQLLRAWLGDTTDLCVVGDPEQAIYRFAGADASGLRDFAHAFPGGETIALTNNYRSASGVVAFAEVALGRANAGRAAVNAIRPRGDAPTIRAYDSDEAEATAVAEQCRQAHTLGVPWHDMAVLFRTNAQSARFETALARRNVPFQVADDLRAGVGPELRALIDRVRELEREAPRRALADHLADLAADELAPTADDARAGRDVFFDLGREYLAIDDGLGDVAGFAAWLEVAAKPAASDSGVDLVTFHRAKGLEWPVVFVTGLERGLVPISRAKTPEAVAEERRLLHVACSRAEDVLHCSWARTRTARSRAVAREPSPWLVELEHEAAAHRVPIRAAAAHLAAARTMLASVVPPEPTSHARRRHAR